MPSSGYRKQTMDFGDMALDLQRAAASFTQMSAAAASFVSFVGAFKAFELQVTKVNSAVGGTAETFKELSAAARNFALVSKYSAGEAASSMVMLAQAGFSAQEAMAAMPAVLELAQASMENLDLVADTVASTIRTYGLNAEDATRITNLFAASVVNSLATVNKLAFSFRQVGPVAAELGLSVEQTAAALDILYNRGLRGEQAGTALRNILIRLIKPTNETYEAFYRLGISLKDSNGQLRNYQDILKDLGTKKVSDTYLVKMFGREALAGAKTLIAATTGEYEKMLDKITDTNTAARMANAQLKTMDGALKLIRNSLTELGIIVGESVGPVVKKVADIVQSFAISLRTMDKDTVSTVKNLAVFTSAIYLVQKVLTSTYAKLVPFAEKVNMLLNRNTLERVFNSFNMSATGDLTAVGLEKVWLAAQQGGKDWLANVNEVYRAMSGGKGISASYAAQIKNMTRAELEAAKSSGLLATGLKAVGISLKTVWVALKKLLPVMVVAWGAFKLIDNWAKERERKAQLKEDLFPELSQLPDKLKAVKLALSKDLPDIVNTYKSAMEAITGAQGTVNKQRNFFSAYGFTNTEDLRSRGLNAEQIIDKLYYSKVRALMQLAQDSVTNRQKLTVDEFYKKGRDLGIEDNLLGELFDGYIESWKITSKDGLESAVNRGVIKADIEEAFMRRSKDLLEAMSGGVKESLKILEKAENELQKLFQKDKSNFIKLLGNRDNAFINEVATSMAVKPELAREIGMAYAYAKLGIPFGTKDPEKWLDDNFNEALKNWNKWNQLSEEDRRKIWEPLISGLSPEAQSAIKTKAEVEVTADLQVAPLDLHTQQQVVAQLKKQYADLLADYKLSWGILSQEQIAQEKIAELQRQIDVNNDSLATKTDKVFQDIFQKTGRVFNADAAKEALKAWQESGNLMAKRKELMDAISNTQAQEGKDVSAITEEQRNYIKLKLEELETQLKINDETNKALEQEKKMNGVIDGRIKGLKQYRDSLNQQIQEREKNAETGSTFENFKEGMDTALLDMKSELDTFWEMGRKGMNGFADFMTNTMNNVVDAWGKGWGAMKDALKNTLADMLKDLAHYYMKQAIYTGITSLVGGFFGMDAVPKQYGTLASGEQVLLPPSLDYRPHAKGGAWNNGLQTFATGGIVNSPTVFNTRSGKGLMGEAGPEAIMPLKRDSQGRLGVTATMGSTLNYAPSFNINVTTGETDTETSQRNTNRMTKELDNKVKNAVLLVLAKEKRPGGLLYAR